VKQVQRAGDADELRDHVGVVDDHQHHHQDEGEPQAELLADQVAQPLPVTTPMRAHISCTTIREMVMGIMVHSSE
jgi:hypothetical protein